MKMKFINIQTDRFAKYERIGTVEKAQLLDCIINYARTGSEPSDDEVSPVVSVLFESIKSDMDYYDAKYLTRCETNRRVGALGGRPRKDNPKGVPENPQETVGLFTKPKEKREKGKEKGKSKGKENISCSPHSGERKREIENKESLSRFEEWWKVYDKKVDRSKALKKWLRLSEKEQMKCIEVAPSYVASTSDKQFRKNPTTYLNGECWNDEIVVRHSKEQSQPTKQDDAYWKRRGWDAPKLTDEEFHRLNGRPEGYDPHR